MKNGSSDSQETPKSLKNDYLSITEIVFKDLRYLTRMEKEIFEVLYYDRNDECNQFDNTLENIKNTANNILITGDAGVGKTSFVYKLVMNSVLMEKHKTYPIVVDYADSPRRSIDSCLLTFINDIDDYFNKMHQPINDLLDKVESNNNDNINRIKTHIIHVDKKSLQKHLIIFIDDLDYAEDDWYKLLEVFYTFASSDIISIVLTARQNLLAAIESYDDRFSLYFARNVEKIHLGTLQVENVLLTRLAPMIIKRESHSFFAFISNLFTSKNPMFELLRRQGISNISDLKKINYPFTKKHNSFMKKITNGNIREIFDIAYESLKYILQHTDLEKRTEDDIERTVIGIPGMIEMLSAPDTCYKLLEMHKYRSKKGNSLLFNVLEYIKIHPLIDDHFYNKLGTFGHNQAQVDWAIKFLNDRANRLIQYERIMPTPRKKELFMYDEIEITEKGYYYLSLVRYKEYIEKYGKFGRSVIDEITSNG